MPENPANIILSGQIALIINGSVKKMEIKFKAQKVTYNEALDGEIINASFYQQDSEDFFEKPSKYLSVSINYEFPPAKPSTEWFDGDKFDGGLDIITYSLEKNSLRIVLQNNMVFDISFDTDENTYKNIYEFLSSACR